MRAWYQVKVKFQKQDEETGLLKMVTEAYYFDAVNYTEVETRANAELKDSFRGEWSVTHVSKTKILDVFRYDEGDYWYRCKVTYAVADADSGKEKKVSNLMLVNAADVMEAHNRLRDSLQDMMVTFRVPEVVETAIVEVYAYPSPDKESDGEAAKVTRDHFHFSLDLDRFSVPLFDLYEDEDIRDYMTWKRVEDAMDDLTDPMRRRWLLSYLQPHWERDDSEVGEWLRRYRV